MSQAKLIIDPPRMEIILKEGVWPDLARMQNTIREAGYAPDPERIGLRVSGKVVADGNGLALDLDRMKKPVRLPLATWKPAPGALDDLQTQLGRVVTVYGYWRPGKEEQDPGTLAVAPAPQKR